MKFSFIITMLEGKIRWYNLTEKNCEYYVNATLVLNELMKHLLL